MTATPPVNRAGVKTGSAADAFQGTPELFPAKLPGSAVIHNNNMHFLAFFRAVKMAGISGNRLTSSTPGKKSQEYS